MFLQLIELDPGDLAVLVHDEHGSIVDEGYRVFSGRVYAIGRRSAGIGPAVRRQWKAKPAEGLLKRDVAENGVGADAHDLGVKVSKAGQVRLDC